MTDFIREFRPSCLSKRVLPPKPKHVVLNVLKFSTISFLITKLMNHDLFEFKDYRAYLKAALPTSGKERGSRVRLADALGVQKGFVSSVLHGNAGLSLEQALKTSSFLSHSPEEREYFLLLVQFARAGSKDLSDYFETKLTEFQKRRNEIRERIQTKKSLSEPDQVRYYSSWHYTAVHMCLMIPQLRTPQAIAAYLHVPLPVVSRVLEFLVETGLAAQIGGKYSAGATRIHLPSESPLVARHHANWRMEAIRSTDRDAKGDLHYSSVMSISKDAAEQIRKILLNSIQAMEPIIRDAKDEGVYVLTTDLFELKSQ